MINTYQSPKLTLAEDEVFVFGSNRDGGFHGCGSAGFASFGKAGNVWREFDYASKPNGWKGKWNVKGVSEGPMLGTEGKSYAIPTVTRAGAKRSIPLPEIKKSIEKFYTFAKIRPNLKFFVAQENKTGLNGYSPEELAEIYSGEIPENVYFDSGFSSLLNKESQNVAQNSKHESSEKIEISSSHLKELHKIVHCKKGKFTQYIGRPPLGQHWDWKYGNPFEIGKDGDRPTVISKMDKWLETGESFGNKNATPERRQWILDHVHELKDETLGCWCNYPKEDCHGRILLERANKEILEPRRGLKVIVAGSRSITDYELVCAAIKESGFEIAEIVCGEAKGIDSLGRKFGEQNNIPIKSFPAPWNDIEGKLPHKIGTTYDGKKYWKYAGHYRNKQMADYADALILIWNGQSKGSANMLKLAQEKGLKIHEKVARPNP